MPANLPKRTIKIHPSNKVLILPEKAIASIERARRFQNEQKQRKEQILALVPEKQWKALQMNRGINNLKDRKERAVGTARKILIGAKSRTTAPKSELNQTILGLKEKPKVELTAMFVRLKREKKRLPDKVLFEKIQSARTRLDEVTEILSEVEKILPEKTRKLLIRLYDL